MTTSNLTHDFRYARIARLSSFHVGSAMCDILVSSVWNRVMISEFGLPSWPVALLLGLRYLLMPISLWAGFVSDNHPIWGLYRSPYIWFGRAMMLLALPCFALCLDCYAGTGLPAIGWFLAVLGFLLYGFGGLLSGSPFIALVRDITPYEKRGVAMALVETVMIAFFPISAICFGYAMEHYTSEAYWRLTLITMGVGGFFWIFSTLGLERGDAPAREVSAVAGWGTLVASLKKALQDSRTRRFFLFLALASLSSWMQDAILEPFGAEVFALSVGETTRFSAHWMGMTLLALILSSYVYRKSKPETLKGVGAAGLLAMCLGMLALGASALTHNMVWVKIGLVLFGAGFGVYTFAGLNLMMVMTTDGNAGLLLGLWTVAQVVSRGVGISCGGVLRDVLQDILGFSSAAYAGIFFLEAAGLALSVPLLFSVDVLGFARQFRKHEKLSDSGTLAVAEF